MKKRNLGNVVAQKKRIWDKFCKLNTLDRVSIVYEPHDAYEDFSDWLGEMVDQEEIDETETDIDNQLKSYKKRKKRGK